MFTLTPDAEGTQTFVTPRELNVVANPDFTEVSQELISEPTTLGNVVEGVVQSAPNFRPQGTPDALAQGIPPQQIAQDIINNLPAFMNNNLQLFIRSLRPADVKRLQDAYNLSQDAIVEVLKIIQGD